MRHVQFILLFLSAIGAHLLFSRYSTADGWKHVIGSEIVNTPNEQPVIVYASVSPGIRQLKWHCLSGQLRIAKVEVKTTRGEKRSFTFSPSVLQAGRTTPPLDLSSVDGTVASVALWYESVPSSQHDAVARVEMLSSSVAGMNP